MNAGSRSYGPYQANPTAYLAMFAIACGMFVSAPAVVLGIALARVARWARVEFAILAALGVAWTAFAWTRVELEITALGAQPNARGRSSTRTAPSPPLGPTSGRGGWRRPRCASRWGCRSRSCDAAPSRSSASVTSVVPSAPARAPSARHDALSASPSRGPSSAASSLASTSPATASYPTARVAC